MLFLIIKSNKNYSEAIEEYNKRLKEEIKFCNEIDSNIKVLSDDYNYDDKKMILAGKRNKFFIGKLVKVKLTNPSVEQKRIDFELVKNVEEKND